MVRIFFILLFLAANAAVGQDQILKRSGEVIYCNIESVEEYYIHFYELGDTSKQLLYKMDAALVNKIAFAGYDDIPFLNLEEVLADETLTGTNIMVETNVDGLFNDFLSLHFQYLKPKYGIDIGLKRFSSPNSVNFFFEPRDDKGSMVEMGISLPMKMLGKEGRPLRGLYLRGFGIYTSGNFQNFIQQGGITKYNQLSFGLQAVLHYQIAKNFYIKTYYGLGATIQVDSFGPPTRRADLSGSDGLQNIYGLRIGYIF